MSVHARLELIRELMASIRVSARGACLPATELAIMVNEELNLMLAPMQRAEMACSKAIVRERERQRQEWRNG